MQDEVLSSGRIRRTDLLSSLNHVGEPVFAQPTQVGPAAASYCSLAVNDTPSGGSRVVNVSREDQCSMAAHWVMEMSVATGECFPVCLSPPPPPQPLFLSSRRILRPQSRHFETLPTTATSGAGGSRRLRLRCRALLRCVSTVCM